VCQDFAHLAVAMYRSLGIPARYVSGYLFAADDATGRDTTVDEIDVQTHAWVEVALPGAGWLALDPTNAQPVGERHVTIGRGRDYDDVSPFRGAYRGPAAHELSAQVHLRRLPAPPAAQPDARREARDGGHRERLGLHVHAAGDGALQGPRASSEPRAVTRRRWHARLPRPAEPFGAASGGVVTMVGSGGGGRGSSAGWV
jgi:hypothetical protein